MKKLVLILGMFLGVVNADVVEKKLDGNYKNYFVKMENFVASKLYVDRDSNRILRAEMFFIDSSRRVEFKLECSIDGYYTDLVCKIKDR